MNKEPTRAEARVLDYVALGKCNKEIAKALFIEVKTVKTHLNNVFPKLGVTNRTQAAIVWSRRSELREVA